ncbi:acyl-CoA thioesterase [Streptomyces sp. NBC_00243]|uniref:acyl-CoA thioesterase n=1 Tax=Streptomyces sp. NBC_00243 TaxID=2975688 RepID=UPI002DD8758E|nr:hotdog domain-containing protein [Streptomyces sp. NBC_00243]WRZ18888.1 acyl-CoA thioesterase [Streptomyces sp. NBC_00243]
MSDQKSRTEIVEVFFDDLDSFGVLHHAKYAMILERGVLSHFAKIGLALGHADLNNFVRELSITYESPVAGMGPVELTFWIEKLGRTSSVIAFRIHSGETLHAYGRRVTVKFDPRTRKPAPWTDSTRHLIEEEFLMKQ